MRTDLLVNNFVYKSVRTKKLTIFEPHFRRNFIHIRDVVQGVVYAINNFIKLKSNIYVRDDLQDLQCTLLHRSKLINLAKYHQSIYFFILKFHKRSIKFVVFRTDFHENVSELLN